MCSNYWSYTTEGFLLSTHLHRRTCLLLDQRQWNSKLNNLGTHRHRTWFSIFLAAEWWWLLSGTDRRLAWKCSCLSKRLYSQTNLRPLRGFRLSPVTLRFLNWQCWITTWRQNSTGLASQNGKMASKERRGLGTWLRQQYPMQNGKRAWLNKSE